MKNYKSRDDDFEIRQKTLKMSSTFSQDTRKMICVLQRKIIGTWIIVHEQLSRQLSALIVLVFIDCPMSCQSSGTLIRDI